MAAKPIEAMQPQREQSGSPPNWQGLIFDVKSAEMVVVVRAKMQSRGFWGGEANSRIVGSSICRSG